MRRQDITGQTFGKLTALRYAGNNKHRKTLWLFQCECGNRKVIESEKVKRKVDAIRSCGCIRASYKTGDDALLNQIFMRSYSDGDLTFEDFKKLSQQDCYYCGAKPANVSRRRRGRVIRKQEFNRSITYNGLNRIDHTLPHNLSNCRSCCWLCNSKISDDSESDFMKWVETIYSKHH